MQISRGKLDCLHRTPAESTALALVEKDFADSGPLVRPGLPHIRFLSVRSRLCIRAAFGRLLAATALAPREPFVPPDLGRGLSPPSCQTCSAHPDLWKSENDFHKGLGKLAENASFPHFHKPYFFIDDRTRPESVTHVSGLICYRCFRLRRTRGSGFGMRIRGAGFGVRLKIPSSDSRNLQSAPIPNLFPLPSSLYPLPSSLYPLPSTLFPLPSSLYPVFPPPRNTLCHLQGGVPADVCHVTQMLPIRGKCCLKVLIPRRKNCNPSR
jgi:hypothetical protein